MRLLTLAARECAYVVVAIQFLTRLPVPALSRFEPAWMARAMAYYPLAGLLVGAISAVVWIAAAHVWPAHIAALLAVAAGTLATGALHEDGLADTADALGGGRTREQRLAILKDSRIGPYGTLALIFAVGLKVMALAVLPAMTGALALLAIHAGARTVPVIATALMPYAGDTSAAKVAPMVPTPGRLTFALVTGLLPSLALSVSPALLIWPAGFAAAFAPLLQGRRLLGGYTGDILGAAEQMYEIAALLTLAAVLGSHIV